MKKTVYDYSALTKKLAEWEPLANLKLTMLEAIGDITIAVRDKDADRALAIQASLMWVYKYIDVIVEMEVEQ